MDRETAQAVVEKSTLMRDYQGRIEETADLRFDGEADGYFVFALGEDRDTHVATSHWLGVDKHGRLHERDPVTDEWRAVE